MQNFGSAAERSALCPPGHLNLSLLVLHLGIYTACQARNCCFLRQNASVQRDVEMSIYTGEDAYQCQRSAAKVKEVVFGFNAFPLQNFFPDSCDLPLGWSHGRS